jgi:hypothetical protein
VGRGVGAARERYGAWRNEKATEAALEEFLSVEQALEQDYGLGTAFYDAMQRTVDGILQFPEMMRVVHESTKMRRVSVVGFPHNVFLPYRR